MTYKRKTISASDILLDIEGMLKNKNLNARVGLKILANRIKKRIINKDPDSIWIRSQLKDIGV